MEGPYEDLETRLEQGVTEADIFGVSVDAQAAASSGDVTWEQGQNLQLRAAMRASGLRNSQ